MESTAVTDLIERQEWLEPAADATQKAVAGIYEAAGPAGQPIQNALNGVWLGHSLHPVLTDIPLGAWTAAAVLDGFEAAGRKEVGPGADAAIGVGLAGALGAAVTGITDWYLLNGGKTKKTGMAHALLNTGATVFYATSWLLRKGEQRGIARILAWMGYATVMASAYLGGSLVSEQGISVNHAPQEDELDTENFTPVLAEGDLPENTLTRAEANGVKVLLVRRGDSIQAISEVCSHLGGPLAEGELSGDCVKCPWHGSEFALSDGHVVNGPATFPQPRFEARLRSGQVEVRAVKTGRR